VGVDDRSAISEQVETTTTDRSGRWARAVVVAVAADLVVVAASGAWLSWNFRPSVASAWRDEYGGPTVDWPAIVTVAHRWSAVALVVLAMVAVGVALVRLVDGRLGVGSLVAAVVALGAAVGGWYTGALLPWDQLALWAVTVGRNMGGYQWLWSDQIRFVLARGHEVPVEDVQRAFLIHLALFVVIVAVALAVGIGRLHRSGQPATAP